MKHAILMDFGSTFTKVVLVDMEKAQVMLTDKFPTTVYTDATIGMNQCFDCVKSLLNDKEFEEALKLSTSSAAGGLRMAVVGLTKSLSITAGKHAIFGAGAKLLDTLYGRITDEDIEELEALKLEIILLCGGYENGNTSLVIENAQKLAESKLHVPIIYSGNIKAAAAVRSIMQANLKECFVIDNIIPRIGELNVAPTQNLIRHLFMQRITNMKGLGNVTSCLDNMLIPTPAAVLEAGELLSKGTPKQEGFGALMLVDVGGATTDIYSYNINRAYEGAILSGVMEPYGKRTVEGDMGMRESSICILQQAGADLLAKEAAVKESCIVESVEKRISEIVYVSDTDTEKRIDQAIAKTAVQISARRHAGHLEYSYQGGCDLLQRGKNLTDVTKVIGTGGIIVNNDNPKELLKAVEKKEKDDTILLPKKIESYVDKEYVLYAAGLLKDYDAEVAFSIMKESIKPV